jgi:hypothetical protein
VYSLSETGSVGAVGQLALLKVKVRSGSALKEIEKAFDTAAKALGLPRNEIEELGVPTCGLESVGRRTEEFGGYRAEINVTGSDAAVRWYDPKGKLLKSAPTAVRKEFAEEHQDWQQDLKDLKGMLLAQRDRIDSLLLERKIWRLADWRERYLDHPLVGSIARRLIWCVDGVAFVAPEGQATDVAGDGVALNDDGVVTLWSAVGRPVEEVLAWRRCIEELRIVQPFRQAHREVYVLTGAERSTRVYSNRFAGHILRQHQFHALCGARRWRNKLRLMVDDDYPPAVRELPEWGLRAEFWIEGLGTVYGVDTNEAAAYLRVSTDQVRFYRMEAASHRAGSLGGGYWAVDPGRALDERDEPVPIEDVPALVFSEVMRDVDLFVSVASVGMDPSWADGGPDGRYVDYWRQVSFGELSGSAAARRDFVTDLLPRLKIAKQCEVTDRFLIVRGELRTYKIHFGSGNVLMGPNDQYLCIVPEPRGSGAEDGVYLPFEGDWTLSVILSKAFLLARDTEIADPVIRQQIESR